MLSKALLISLLQWAAQSNAGCVKSCFAFYDPQCGTDGNTYQNMCYLENAICLNAHLKLSNNGECIGSGACALGCGTGYQLSYNGLMPGAYAVPACGPAVACVPVSPNCVKACPQGYYMCSGYNTHCIQYSACGSTIWCQPDPLMPANCVGTFCQNNGYMTYSAQSCICNCLDGYYGSDCSQLYSDNCAGLQCANNALVVGNIQGCTCSCPNGYSGSYCQGFATESSCGLMSCHNGGVLTQGTSGCSCTCVNGFYGKNCETAPNCPNQQCQNGGFTTLVNNVCVCSCPFGFYGNQCQSQQYGTWVSIQNMFYNFCLDQDISGNIVIQPCVAGKSSQTFLVKTNYLMTWDEQCVTIMGPDRTGNLALESCNFMTNQYFVIQEPAIQTFDQLCVDIQGANYAAGTPVIVWTCLSAENQAWQLQPAFPPVQGSGCPAFLCEVDPCQVLTCPLNPAATCVPDYCTCDATFQINGNPVTCNPMAYPSSQAVYSL